MFLSILGGGYILSQNIRKSKKKLGITVLLLTVTGVSIAMTAQLVSSVQKLQMLPTGSKVEYLKAETNMNLSFSICLDGTSFPNREYNYTEIPLDGVFRRALKDTPWIKYEENEIKTFIWSDKADEIHFCLTVKFDEEEIKMTHRFTEYHLRSIYVHDTGLLTAGNSIKLDGNLLNENNIIILEAKQIHKMEEENVCTNSDEFDLCREDYISEQLNASKGCLSFINR